MKSRILAVLLFLTICPVSVQLCFAGNPVVDSTYTVVNDSAYNEGSVKVAGVDFGLKGPFLVDARVASANEYLVGSIELHIDSLKGTLIGTCAVITTGGWQKWATRTCSVKSTTGVHDLYFKFVGGNGLLFRFDSWKLISQSPPSTLANKCPCDIYNDGGTPCVAAHSTVRALFSSYNGPLYQIKRKSDNKTLDIGVLNPGGFANVAAADSFLKGTTGTFSIIYDQSERKNDLTISLYGSAAPGPLSETPLNRLKDTLCGYPVYPVAKVAGEGYRRNVTNGIAAGQQPEGMYWVVSGKRYNSDCCFDYGNAEVDAIAGGKPTGAMEALYFGNSCWFTPCNGNGPWAFADLEWGLFQGSANGTTNTSIPYKYVASYLKGDIQTYTIRANDATLDALKTMGSSNRPGGWQTNRLTGAVILGIGGDSSAGGIGTFYEGAMTCGRPSDSTENAVQKHISQIYSGKWKPVSIQNSVNISHSNYPCMARFNPSSGIAMISYTSQDVGHVKLTIFNEQGKQVASLSKGIVTSGQHEVDWNTKQVSSGLYFWRIALDGRDIASGKVVIGK